MNDRPPTARAVSVAATESPRALPEDGVMTRIEAMPGKPRYRVIVARREDIPDIDLFAWWDTSARSWRVDHERVWRCSTWLGARFKVWYVRRKAERQLRAYRRAEARVRQPDPRDPGQEW